MPHALRMSSAMLMFERDGTSPTFSGGVGSRAAGFGCSTGVDGVAAGGGGSEPHAARTIDVARAKGSFCIDGTPGLVGLGRSITRNPRGCSVASGFTSTENVAEALDIPSLN